MIFEWDEQKNKINIRKHGIAFEVAAKVFLDPNALILFDQNEKEERWDVIGFVGSVLFVVFTEKDDEILRIISARKATRKEINEYCSKKYR